VLAAVAVAGCGGAETLPSDRVERRLDRELVKPVGLGGKIRCPDGIEQKEGENFTCEVTLGDRTEKVQVIQRDEGRLSFKPLPSK
jgi:Domain of unknown function (DUF4333)